VTSSSDVASLALSTSWYVERRTYRSTADGKLYITMHCVQSWKEIHFEYTTCKYSTADSATPSWHSSAASPLALQQSKRQSATATCLSLDFT
jgi:hypothetical protein